MLSLFKMSGQGVSAQNKLEECIQNDTACVESVSINIVPIYYLQPNTKIYIRDDKNNIEPLYQDIVLINDKLFAGMKDEKYRENQFYNVLNCYICGDLSGASIYQAKAMCKPEGLWQKIRYGYRVSKARKQLRSLLSFIDRSRCRQKFLDYKDNEDYCMCMKLILNVRQPDKKAHDFLQRRVSHERRYLDNLKLIAEKSEANLYEKEDKQIKKVIEWISKEQAVNNSTTRIQSDKLLLKGRLH